MDKVPIRMTVKVLTGETFSTDWTEAAPEELEFLQEYLSKIHTMSKFSITTADEDRIHINPSHIVYSYTETK